MKKFLLKSTYALLLLFGLSNYTSSQEYFNYDDYVYEDEDIDSDDYDSFFDDDEYDLDYYESANIGELVYNPVTGRMQRSYYYVGRTLYILDMETGGYYPIRNRFRRSIGYPDRFYSNNFWSGRPNFAINFNFNGRFYNPYWGNRGNWSNWRGYGRRNFNNYGWGVAFGGINGFSLYYNNRFGPYSPYRRYYIPYRPNRGWWGWYGPGGWNVRQNNRSNVVNVGNFSSNRNIRLANPNGNRNRTRSTSNRNSGGGQNGISNRSNNPRGSSGRSDRDRPNSGIRGTQRSSRSSDIVQSRRRNRVNSPSRGETVRSLNRDQYRSSRNYAQTSRNEPVTRSRSLNSRSERRNYDRNDRRDRSNYDRNERSGSQSRKIKESRNRNQIKSERSSRSQKKYESRSKSSSRSSSQNRSKSSSNKYSSGRNNKSSSYKQKSNSNRSKKAGKRFQ